MWRFFLLVFGVVVAFGVYSLYKSLSSTPDPVTDSNYAEEVIDSTEVTLALTQEYTANVGVLPNNFLFTITLPQGTQVRTGNNSSFIFAYGGSQNEPPGLTDGIGMNISLLLKQASGTLESFVDKEFVKESEALSTKPTITETYGRIAYHFDTRAKLSGGPTEHIYFAVDDEHVALVTVTLHGNAGDRSRYQKAVTEMLDSLNFLQVGEVGDTSLLEISSPGPGDSITSPVTVRGEAMGGWYFEASFPIVITDWDGRIVGEGYATAEGDWMTDTFVPFEGMVEYTLATTSLVKKTGSVIFKRANASGLPEHDASVEVPIRFSE